MYALEPTPDKVRGLHGGSDRDGKVPDVSMPRGPITALTNGRVFIGRRFVEDRAVLIDGHAISAIVPADDPVVSAGTRHDVGGRLVVPGFIDLQVNGGGGILFNAHPTMDGLRAIAAAHRRFGTATLLPTLISDDLEVIVEALAAVGAAISIGMPGIAGIHLEGPFLNPARKGAHDARKLRRLESAHVDLLLSLERGHTVVTVAPEMAEPGTIRALVDGGALVSAGHTDASYDVMRRGFDEGVTGVTHLFNAMSPLSTRAPGAVGAALENQTAWCGLIVDGKHVDPAVLKLALKCRPPDRFLLVTDAMPSVGAVEKSFMLQGRRITVQDGVCVDEHGTLSGADLDMASAVRNAVRLLGVSLEDAISMATEHPARYLGREDLGRIVPGARANFVVCDDQLSVAETWIDGQPI